MAAFAGIGRFLSNLAGNQAEINKQKKLEKQRQDELIGKLLLSGAENLAASGDFEGADIAVDQGLAAFGIPEKRRRELQSALESQVAGTEIPEDLQLPTVSPQQAAGAQESLTRQGAQRVSPTDIGAPLPQGITELPQAPQPQVSPEPSGVSAQEPSADLTRPVSPGLQQGFDQMAGAGPTPRDQALRGLEQEFSQVANRPDVAELGGPVPEPPSTPGIDFGVQVPDVLRDARPEQAELRKRPGFSRLLKGAGDERAAGREEFFKAYGKEAGQLAAKAAAGNAAAQTQFEELRGKVNNAVKLIQEHVPGYKPSEADLKSMLGIGAKVSQGQVSKGSPVKGSQIPGASVTINGEEVKLDPNTTYVPMIDQTTGEVVAAVPVGDEDTEYDIRTVRSGDRNVVVAIDKNNPTKEPIDVFTGRAIPRGKVTIIDETGADNQAATDAYAVASGLVKVTKLPADRAVNAATFARENNIVWLTDKQRQDMNNLNATEVEIKTMADAYARVHGWESFEDMRAQIEAEGGPGAFEGDVGPALQALATGSKANLMRIIGASPDAKTLNDSRIRLGPLLTRGMGDRGNLGQNEQETMRTSLFSATNSPAEVVLNVENFANARSNLKQQLTEEANQIFFSGGGPQAPGRIRKTIPDPDNPNETVTVEKDPETGEWVEVLE